MFAYALILCSVPAVFAHQRAASLRANIVCNVSTAAIHDLDPFGYTRHMVDYGATRCENASVIAPFGIVHTEPNGDEFTVVDGLMYIKANKPIDSIFCPAPIYTYTPVNKTLVFRDVHNDQTIISVVGTLPFVLTADGYVDAISIEDITRKHKEVRIMNATALAGLTRLSLRAQLPCGTVQEHVVEIINIKSNTMCGQVPAVSVDRLRCDTTPIRVAGSMQYVNGTCTATCSPGTTFYCTPQGWVYTGPIPINCKAPPALQTFASFCDNLASFVVIPEGLYLAASSEDAMACVYKSTQSGQIRVVKGLESCTQLPTGMTGGAALVTDATIDVLHCSATVVDRNTSEPIPPMINVCYARDLGCSVDLECLSKATDFTITTNNRWSACSMTGRLPPMLRPPAGLTEFVGNDDWPYYYAATSSLTAEPAEDCSLEALVEFQQSVGVPGKCYRILGVEAVCLYLTRVVHLDVDSSFIFGSCITARPIFPFADTRTLTQLASGRLLSTGIVSVADAPTPICEYLPHSLSTKQNTQCRYYPTAGSINICTEETLFALYSPDHGVLCDDYHCLAVGLDTTPGTFKTYSLPFLASPGVARITLTDVARVETAYPSCSPLIDRHNHLLLINGGSASSNRSVQLEMPVSCLAVSITQCAKYYTPSALLSIHSAFLEHWDTLETFRRAIVSSVYFASLTPFGTFEAVMRILSIIGLSVAFLIWCWYTFVAKDYRFYTRQRHYLVVNVLVAILALVPTFFSTVPLLLDFVLLPLLWIINFILLWCGRRVKFTSLGALFIYMWFTLYRGRRLPRISKAFGVMRVNYFKGTAKQLLFLWMVLSVQLPPADCSNELGRNAQHYTFTPTATRSEGAVTYKGSVEGHLRFGKGYAAHFDAVDSSDDRIAYSLHVTMEETDNSAACTYMHTCGSLTVAGKSFVDSDDESCACAAVQSPHCLFYEKDRMACDSWYTPSEVSQCKIMKGSTNRCADGDDIDYDAAISSTATSWLEQLGPAFFLGDTSVYATLSNIGLLHRGSEVSVCSAQALSSTDYVHAFSCSRAQLSARVRVTLDRIVGGQTATITDELVEVSDWNTIELPGTKITFKPPAMSTELPNALGVYASGADVISIFSGLPSATVESSACNAFVGVPSHGYSLNVLGTGISAHSGGCSITHNPTLDISKFQAAFPQLNTVAECRWSATLSSRLTSACRDMAYHNAPLCETEDRAKLKPIEFEYDIPELSIHTESCDKVIPFVIDSELTLEWQEVDDRLSADQLTISNCRGYWGREGSKCQFATSKPGVVSAPARFGQAYPNPTNFWLQDKSDVLVFFPYADSSKLYLWDGTYVELDMSDVNDPSMLLPDPDEDQNHNTLEPTKGDETYDWLALLKTIGIVLASVLGGLVALWLLWMIAPLLLSCFCGTAETNMPMSRSSKMFKTLYSKRR